MTRGRCGNCGRSRPDTVPVWGSGGGNWRRANRRIRRRLCRECVEAHVRYVRSAPTANLDTGGFQWSAAAAAFGIDVEGLPRTPEHRRALARQDEPAGL